LLHTVVALHPEGTGKEEKALRIAPGMLFFSPVWMLEHLPCEKRPEEPGLFNLEEIQLQRDLRATLSACGNVIEETKLSSSQWCKEEKEEIC